MKQFIFALLKKIQYPQPLFLLCFYAAFPITVTGTILLLVFTSKHSAIHYIFYLLSALGLAYFVYTTVSFLLPKIKNTAIFLLQRSPFTNHFLESYSFRTLFFALLSFFINSAYAVFQAALGIAIPSVWNLAIAAFYFVLIALKGCVLFCEKKYKYTYEKQIKTYRACGYLFNLFTLAIIGILFLINKENMYYAYSEYALYLIAAYTFSKIISAIIQFFKAKKQDGLLIQAIRNINLVSALYSVLVLQISMYQAFDHTQNHLFNLISGAIIACFILLISLHMISKSCKSTANTLHQ